MKSILEIMMGYSANEEVLEGLREYVENHPEAKNAKELLDKMAQ